MNISQHITITWWVLWLDGCGSVGFHRASPSRLAKRLATVELFLWSVSGDDATAAVHTRA